MNDSMRYFIIYIVLFVTLLGCKKDPATIVDLGYDYYPIQEGHWVIYNVDSIVYNDFTNSVDTFQYQIKELIVSTYQDAEGRNTQRIERYKRINSGPWIIKDVWSSNLTSTTAERVEENTRYVKLAFPAKIGMSWDGNVANVISEWEYLYTTYDEAASVGLLSFDSVLTVLQRDQDLGALEKDYFVEMYAKNIGLIYKEAIHLEQDLVDPTWLNPERGYRYKMTVSSFNNK